ncbi:ATPase WRNIP1 isoform X2 [Chiloscyllium punctatum]|uniref:ATPase WRNIP1 isoform X2 n=1 Tax=Chiloscyllium punctatum TaxID=137246 RepID=UPI003B6420B3
MAQMQGDRTSIVHCPVCSQQMQSFRINAHLDHCLGVRKGDGESDGEPGSKRPRLSPGAACGDETSLLQSGRDAAARAPPGLARGDGTLPGQGEREAAASSTVNDGKSRCGASLPRQTPATAASTPSPQGATVSLLQQLEAKPLAEIMRPTVLAELIGQNKVLGENTLLRTLLESHEIPSIILWGPPGCGKTSLAHVLASNSKKQNSSRFVSLSATNAATDVIREVVKQAQNELKLFKRRTIVFFDEIHHFNKTQQNTLLPHVECGTITLIGATTENPSFQINSALLSRCRVIVLEKLSVEAMETILLRALNSLGISILGQDKEASSVDGSKESELHISIEPEAIRSIAYLCDGDARAALNGLHLAIQAKVAEAKKPQNDFAQKNTLAKKILIKEMHIKEGLQRSHILYDRAGLADPLALTQAVSAYQGCHFIGMPECEVILAQCVTYLSRAPKSVEVYMAYDAVKESLRNHKGPLPSVPLHLRNAPTKLMKDLGYGKDYKYCSLNKPEDNPCSTKE